jgi:lipopolysaccharide transport system ATP-binding protein
MSNMAIRACGLSKQFQIGTQQQSYRTLRDTIADAVVSPFRKMGKLLRGQASGAAELDETITALSDVSFEIAQGEVVGIIGRNGAGKSTLLKVLSRITEPSSGYVDIHGRVGSLLEVGTGFHPELTGRENVFLNGAILGMRRAEILRKFDEMVAFAEVERFIDTPVKHYSSGMYLRLAFAVAAHLEPEILIVDEVLAVGDARFQKKCLNKMEEVGNEGRTVLFVSHSMPSITRLCKRAILLDEGRILNDGPAYKVVRSYLNSGLGTTAAREWSEERNSPGGEIARLRGVRVVDETRRVTDVVNISDSVGLELEYHVLQDGYNLLPYYHIYNEDGVNVFQAHDTDPQWRKKPRSQGRYISTVWIPGHFLSEGTFFVTPGLAVIEPIIGQFHERDVIAFQVVDDLKPGGARGDFAGVMGGVVRPLLKWTNEYLQARELQSS